MQKSYLLGPAPWKVMQRNVWIDIANLRIRRLNSYTKSQHHAWMSITKKKKKKKNQWENCLQYAHKLFSKCLHLARIGRPDIVWSVNKVARADTKWTKSCDEILMRLISHMHHTSEHVQNCSVGKTTQQRKLGLLQDSDFAGDLEDSKSTTRGVLCIFRESHVCSSKLDVQEIEISVTRLHGSGNHFS